MKLTMKNQYSFQEAMGYGDDPSMMSAGEVKSHIGTFRAVVSSLADNPVVTNFHDELVQLESFLNELAYRSEVEYEQPLKKFGYHAGFEYYCNFEVAAESQDEADKAALKLFKSMAEEMPKRINKAEGCFKYLEQYDPDWGCDKRIYED